ncbi:coniferyl aldehyde dehydrogenase [Halomonas sp. B23F22_10]|uniref:coniferyl aldehyde dehydrogenase n=1 Tax=Halomonas sp. B23F22_10 TaxID=3459515 RepID=UPI00373E4A92
MSSENTRHDLLKVLNSMKQRQAAAGTADAALRKDRLQRGIRLIRDHHEALIQAMSDDFGHRSHFQAGSSDLAGSIKMLQHAIDHVDEWMQAETAEAPDPGMTTEIHYQPLGVVGVISPWNFPINLAFGPLAGVFAAGNTAMLKPSELTPRTSDLLAELIGRYYGPEELAVVLGEADVAQAFSTLPFDHLVFTGSTAVGRHVMRAAADNLVPVTLELGGKSPVLVSREADLTKAVERTLTGKTFNAGQICIAPDYVLLPEEQTRDFTALARDFLARSYPSVQHNDDYTAIVSDRHYQRLISLLEDAREKGAEIVNLGPEDEPAYREDSRKIAPHLVIGATDDMAIMQEEIFGPLLPIRTYDQEREAVAYITGNPRPLAAYYFSEDTEAQRAFAESTISGALVVNDVMAHVSIDSLPFGGVGPSGIGAYHGVHGFRRFSHAKPLVVQSEEGLGNLRLRAPYDDKYAELKALLEG